MHTRLFQATLHMVVALSFRNLHLAQSFGKFRNRFSRHFLKLRHILLLQKIVNFHTIAYVHYNLCISFFHILFGDKKVFYYCMYRLKLSIQSSLPLILYGTILKEKKYR